MKHKKIAFFVPLLALILLSACSLIKREVNLAVAEYQLSGFTQADFSDSRLSDFQEYKTIAPDPQNESSVYVGDVVGDSANEIVCVQQDRIYIYTLDGELIKEKGFEGMKFGSGILADIDEDGKKDIILGAAEDKGVRFFAYSGVLEQITEFLYSEMYNAETTVHFFHDGRLYFSARSSLFTPPKIIGAYDVEQESLSWEYYTGPSPIDIAADSGFTKLTISNRPKNATGLMENEKPRADHSKHRSSIYVLDAEGTVKTQVSIGPEYRVGEFIDGGISSLTERLCDIDDDGEAEVLVGLNRLSEFFVGNAALQLRSLSGALLHEREFLPSTELEFNFYKNNNEREILVLLKQRGRVHVLDSQLNSKCIWNAPGIKGEAILHKSGDYNGDGHIEHLLSISNHIFILDSQLNPLYSTALESRINQALIAPDREGRPLLLVRDRDLHIFRIGTGGFGTASVYSDPPGADIFMNGFPIHAHENSGILANLPVGEATFHAELGDHKSDELKIEVKAGVHSIVNLNINNYEERPQPVLPQRRDISVRPKPSTPLSEWSDIQLIKCFPKQENESLVSFGYRDFAGDEEKDFLFLSGDRRTLRTYSSEMKLLGEFQLPHQSRTMLTTSAWMDTDKNSKAEILVFRHHRQEFSIFSADGKLIEFRRFNRLPDSVFRPRPAYVENALYIAVSSGYSLQPRGIMKVDLTDTQAEFFYPTASMTNSLLLTPDKMMLPFIYTPDNGYSLTYPNGDTANDSEYFIHITDEEGRHLEQSSQLDMDENDGYLWFYSLDFNMDGEKEIYAVMSKSDYRTGTCKIARFDPKTGALSPPLFSAEKNTQMYIHSLLKRNKHPVLAVYTIKPRMLYLLDKRFSPLIHFNLSERGYHDYHNWAFGDLDNDGTSEMYLLNESDFSVYDLDFNLLYREKADLATGAFKNLILDKRDSDGKEAIIIISEKAVSFYSY